MIKYFHRRLAELSLKLNTIHGLNSQEAKDYRHCLILNEEFVGAVQTLEAMSIVAHEMKDQAWQQEIKQQMEQLMTDPHLTKIT